MAFVIGAGIVGVTQALSLAKRGLMVTLIDPRGIGMGTTFGNSGFICPSLAYSMAPEKLITADWKYRFPYPYTKDQSISSTTMPMKWMCEFLLGQRHRTKYDLKLQSIANGSRDFYENYDGEMKGGLHLYRNPINNFDDEFPILSGSEIATLEPSISLSRSPINQGKLVTTDTHIDPYNFTKKLGILLNNYGVNFIQETLEDIVIENSSVKKIITDQDTYFPDLTVLSTGHESHEIINKLNLLEYINLPPILPALGYSLTVQIDWDRVNDKGIQLPKYAISDLDRMCTYLPLTPNKIRVAAFLDFYDTSDYPSIIKSRHKQMRLYLEDLFPWISYPVSDPTQDMLWVGTRSLTPSGIPIFKKFEGIDNLYLNTAHGRLGMTLGPSTSELLTNQIIGL